MAEADRTRIAALLAADADLQIRVGGTAQVDAHLHQHTDALDVEGFKGIVVEDPGVGVERQELVFRILAREGVDGLGQIVGTEGEELGQFGQIAGAGTGPNRFDHGAELEGQGNAVMGFDLGADLVDAGAHALQFLYGDDLRDHDFRTDLNPRLEATGLGFQDGPQLHFVDFRIRDAETDATMAEQRVDLVQVAHLLQHQFLLGDDAVDVILVDAGVGALRLPQGVHGGQRRRAALDGQPVFLERLDFVEQLRLAGQELMHGRVEQSHRHRIGRNDAEHFLEILALHRQQLVQRGLTLFQRAGHDHFDDDWQPFHRVKHALGAAETDAPGAVFHRHLGHVGRIAVGHDLEPGFFVGPAEQGVQFVGELRRQGWDFTQVNVAVGAVDGDDVAFAQGDVADLGHTGPAVDHDALGAGHAGLAHAARDDGGV